MKTPVPQPEAQHRSRIAGKTPRNASAIPEKSDNAAKRRHTNMHEILAMVSFIENPDKFALIEGKAAKNKPVISGQKLTKSAGYQDLANYVNCRVKQNRKWNAQLAKSRYTSYRDKKYKVAKKMSSPGSTGFGITEEDRRKGIYTMAEKLEKICPFYNHMDAVFGSRQNITPACVLETGVRGEFFPPP